MHLTGKPTAAKPALTFKTCRQFHNVPNVLHSKILHGDYIAFMCFVWLSEQTVTFALYITYRLDFITEVENVHCAVRIESLYSTDTPRS